MHMRVSEWDVSDRAPPSTFLILTLFGQPAFDSLISYCIPPKRDNKDREDNEVKFSAILNKPDALNKGKADSDGKLG